LRELILGYKERGRHRLARPLGALLAEGIAAAAPAGVLPLVYVPDTGGAARKRHGDHMRALASHAAETLTRAGRPVRVVDALRTRPGTDSAELDASARAYAAQGKFSVRSPLPSVSEVVLVDDIITTGSTLAAATAALRHAGVDVKACVVLAATQLHAHD
jgi:predicted amidophosphoribosyltransferase